MTDRLGYLKETASQTAGPYVHIGLIPHQAGFDIFQNNFGAEVAGPGVGGERILVEGRVIDGTGTPLRDALIETWQANACGRYRHRWDRFPAPLDPNFDGAGRTITDDDGRYRFVTIKPGPYPWRNFVNSWRPAHIHFSVFGTAFAQRLITQMYFEGDPMIWQCPIAMGVPDRVALQQLVAALDRNNSTHMDSLAYKFDVVLRGRRSTPFENRKEGN